MLSFDGNSQEASKSSSTLRFFAEEVGGRMWTEWGPGPDSGDYREWFEDEVTHRDNLGHIHFNLAGLSEERIQDLIFFAQTLSSDVIDLEVNKPVYERKKLKTEITKTEWELIEVV